MPPFDDVSLRFMLQIISGYKLAINLGDIRPLHIPRLSELKLKNLLDEVKEDGQIQ